jgi:hypothetical protein
MTYKELIDTLRKHPDCFWDEKQRIRNSEYKYKSWVNRKNIEWRSSSEADIKRNNKI